MIDRGRRVSVIVCAYSMDRWGDLREAVRSLGNQRLKPHEVIVVIDHNPDLLARAAEELRDVRVVANRERPGLSGARNTGVAVAEGSLIAFLDDDAVADPCWLERLAGSCEGPDVLAATGLVMPRWLGERPGWFPEEFLWVVGCSFRGAPETATSEVRNVLGSSMMFRREVFERAGGFSHQLGRSDAGANLLSCEETEFCLRAKLVFPSARIMSNEAAIVWHKVPASRLSWGYFFRRCYAEGLSKALLASLVGGGSALATERTYVMRGLGAGFLRGITESVLSLERDGIMRSAAIVAGLVCASAGYLAGTSRYPRPTRRRGEGRSTPGSDPGPAKPRGQPAAGVR